MTADSAFGILRHLIFLAFGVIASHLPAYGQTEKVDLSKTPLFSVRIGDPPSRLAVYGGKLIWDTDSQERVEDHPRLPRTAIEQLYQIWDDGTHLRLFACTHDGRAMPNESLHGWYLSGDYTTNPAGVILTKEPGENSEWSVTSAGENRKVVYLRNVSKGEKKGWLSMGQDGPLVVTGTSVSKLCPVILVPDTRTRIWLRPYKSPDGSK